MTRQLLPACLTVLMLALSCTRPDKVVRNWPAGVDVTVVREGHPGQTGNGRVLELAQVTLSATGDTLFNSRSFRRGFRIFLDGTSAYNAGLYYRVLLASAGGDSLLLRLPAVNLYDSTLKQPLPAGVVATDTLAVHLGILKEETTEAHIARRTSEYGERRKKLMAEQDSITVADGQRIDAFLTAEKAVFLQTEAGIRYMMAQNGPGRAPSPGDRVKVHYRGTLLDGTLFDSSYDRDQPFQFRYGVGDVIFGFDEGVGLLTEGGKVTVLIPSPLAYGAQKRSEVILPNSMLVFEIELLEVIGR